MALLAFVFFGGALSAYLCERAIEWFQRRAATRVVALALGEGQRITRIDIATDGRRWTSDTATRCEKCAGTGNLWKPRALCPDCKGLGWLP